MHLHRFLLSIAMWFFALLAFAPVVLSSTGSLDFKFDWTLGVDGALHFSSGTRFYALNSDGSTKWTYDATFPIVTHKEGLNGTIHIIAQSVSKTDRMHYALDGIDGSIRWQQASHDTGSCYANALELLISDSTVYSVCKPNRIEAIDVDGTWKWTELVPNATQVDVGPDGGLLVQTRETYPYPYAVKRTYLSALQPENGAVKWTQTTDELFYQSDGLAFSGGNIFVAPLSRTGKTASVLLLNGDDGSILRNVSYSTIPKMGVQHPTPLDVRPISGCNMGEVYVTNLKDENGNCSIQAFDYKGYPLRTLPCFDSKFQHSTLQNGMVEEDIFVTQHRDGFSDSTFINAYSGTTGQMLWREIIDGFFTLQDIGADGTVLATDGDQVVANKVVAIRNGHMVWQAPAPHFLAVLMAKDGTTYLLLDSEDTYPFEKAREVVALDTNGTQKWSYQITDPNVSAFAVV